MDKKIKVKIGEREYVVEIDNIDTNPISVMVDGDEVEVYIDQLDSKSKPKEEKPSNTSNISNNNETSSGKTFYSPMPGSIISVSVKEGDQVITGDDICILEAMKMQQSLKADWSGIVKKVFVSSGDQVNDGSPIIELE
ncbi:MAG: hypothetical protein CL758_00180 [Chloroflexi bacterium]|nr:hypothetical protein [Chloroflexota bacterium]|tara:strand:- start:2553 stop:2966 length:414 start_codon:yes stop_codon:yes gene_type:complete